MNVEECVQKGLLKKERPDLARAKASLEIAQRKLEIAEREFAAEIYENALVTAYTAMFHTARSLLFRDGYKERSHFAISVYLAEKYGNRIERKYLQELNALRMERHEIMYGLEQAKEVQEVEAESAIALAQGFLKAVEKLVAEK